MDFRKLSLALAALTITGLATPAAAVQSDDLKRIRVMVDARDHDALRAFLAANPDVMDTSPLGMMLRKFYESPPRTLLDRLSFVPPIPIGLQQQLESRIEFSSLY